MTPDDIIKLLDATCICGEQSLHRNIQHAFAADLMSDVMRVNTEDIMLLSCKQSMYRVCGELYKARLPPVY